MRESHRISAAGRLQLEALDARVMPSAMHLALVQHAALERAMAVRHLQTETHVALPIHRATALRMVPRVVMPRAISFAPAVPTQFSATIHYTGGMSTAVATPVSAPAVTVTMGSASTFAIRPPSSTTPAPVASAPVSSTPTISTGTTGTSATTTTTTDVSDVENGPLAKGGQDLVAVYVAYQAYIQAGGTGTFDPPQASFLEIEGTSIGVDVRGSGDLGAFATALANLGMQVQGTDASTHTVEGLVPIAQLVNVAQLPQTTSLAPIYGPQVN